MLIQRYQPYFYNANFCEDATTAGWSAFRGELVLQEGEIADAQGRRKPPSDLLKEAVVLTCNEDLMFIAGLFDQLENLSVLLQRYGSDIKANTSAIFFVVNISAPFMIEHNETKLTFIPLVQGMIWNELMDISLIDKSDLKKLSGADKVIEVYNVIKTKTFNYPISTLEIELGKTNTLKREAMGSV